MDNDKRQRTRRRLNKIFPANLLFFALIFSACADNQTKSHNQTPITLVRNNSNIETRKTDAKTKDSVAADNKSPVVKPSNLIEKLRKKKNENPKMTARELADYGNEILSKEGYDYTFDWEPKGNKNEANLKKSNLGDYLPYEYEFTATDGKKQMLQFLNKGFEHPCFSVIDVPVTQINEQTMTVIAAGKAVDLKRPKDFDLEEFALVDNSKKIIRKWKTPIDATPVGISEDGKKVYFDSYQFYQDATDGAKESPIDLALEISEDGSLKLVDSNEVKSGKGVVIDYDKKYTEIQYEKYKIGNKEYIIKYSAPCT